MSKGKGSGSFRGRDAKTGQPIQIPQVKRPQAPSVPTRHASHQGEPERTLAPAMTSKQRREILLRAGALAAGGAGYAMSGSARARRARRSLSRRRSFR